LPKTDHQKALNAARQARWRERKRRALAPESVHLDRDDDASDPGSSQLLPSGIEPSADESDADLDLMKEQALWVKRRRTLTEIEIQRRRGELIPVEEARLKVAALSRRIRAALDRMPSHLPADISPDARAAATKAMAHAVKIAMANL